ncbi:hypothetical protein [Corynebacterium nasicanis]|uniref:Secreted protein n=1 Tax=Corynebacterium nasicanis TaxID=1448267 RepID=A0ABW1Q9W3_9CORY
MNLRNILTAVGVILIGTGIVTSLVAYTQSGMPLLALTGLAPAFAGLVTLSTARSLAPRTLSATALLGIGTVEKLEPTGMSINDTPQYRITLRVRGADLQEFTGQLKMFIPPHELAALPKGTMLPVAYEPSKPQALIEVPADRMPEAQDLIDRQRVHMGLADPQGSEIHARGLSTTGVIMAVTPTGEIRHGHTGLEITLKFPTSSGALVERSKVSFLSPALLSQLTVGRQVTVFYLPEDDTRFSFEISTIDENITR